MHTSIGQNYIGILDYCLIVSKFSVKCEATHKNIVIVVFNAQGRVGTYRQVLCLTITVCSKLQVKAYKNKKQFNVTILFAFNNLE